MLESLFSLQVTRPGLQAVKSGSGHTRYFYDVNKANISILEKCFNGQDFVFIFIGYTLNQKR